MILSNPFRSFMKKCAIILTFLFVWPLCAEIILPNYLQEENWDDPVLWRLDRNLNSTLALSSFPGVHDDGIRIDYHLSPGRNVGSYVRMIRDAVVGFTNDNPIVLLIRAKAQDDIELKFEDTDGSVFIKRYSIQNHYTDWNQIVIYLDDTAYGWGGDSQFGTFSKFEIAFSGDSSGTVWIDEIGVGKPGLMKGRFLDPYRDAEGIGFLQRRSESSTPSDPLVLEYLKVLQDSSSDERQVLPNDEKTKLVSTFNNGLAAMAFILIDEKERAEAILDFYAARTDSGNQSFEDQAFFYAGEARGFYQQMLIPDYTRGGATEDRWIGDMAWLAMAYKHYEKKYGFRDGYPHVVELIRDLFLSFFKEIDADQGFVQTGWQDGDTRFDSTGHYEGNIDCYAVMKECGEIETARKIKNWLHARLTGSDLWSDNYTWRVLAFCEEADSLLSIPEFDFRFRKKVVVNQDSLYGFYSHPDETVQNIWVEGLGHMACAQIWYGDPKRGYFYANQLDPLLLSYSLFGKDIKTLPYSLNRTGDYQWVDPTRGSVSPAVWYIFAKNGCNPLSTEAFTRVDPDRSEGTHPQGFRLFPNFPNPFNPETTIHYSLVNSDFVELKIFDILGREVAIPIHGRQSAGDHRLVWNGKDEADHYAPSGVYLCVLSCGGRVETQKMLLLR